MSTSALSISSGGDLTFQVCDTRVSLEKAHSLRIKWVYIYNIHIYVYIYIYPLEDFVKTSKYL